MRAMIRKKQRTAKTTKTGMSQGGSTSIGTGTRLIPVVEDCGVVAGVVGGTATPGTIKNYFLVEYRYLFILLSQESGQSARTSLFWSWRPFVCHTKMGEFH